MSFGPGAIVVETPHRQRGPVQIGNEDLIRVPFHLEEVQLRGGFLGHWATNDDEPRRPLPPLRTIAELGRPDAAPDLTVAQSAQAVFDGSCQSSRDRIPRAALFQPCPEKPIVKGSVGPYPKWLALGQPAQCLLDDRTNNLQDMRLPGMS